MPKVIDYKLKNNLEIFDKKREKGVLKEKEKQATERKLNPRFIKRIYQEIMDESKKIQKKYVKKK